MSLNLRVVSTTWFGRRPPQGSTVLATWGARAILAGRGRDQYIDVVHDRQQAWMPAFGDDTRMIDLPRPFLAFLRGRAHLWLRNRCDERWINPGGGDVFTLLDGRMVAQASPQRSYGYLYVGAWMLEEPETAP